ncbi:MAG: HAD hydrolase-like protein [Bacteroidota bacterium]|nr:HAD hydrolase-like protein [Bacteroidota bacterium]
MDIKLVILDMAGTTVHDEDYVNIALQQALFEEGINCSREEINSVMGMPKPVAIKILLEQKLSDKSKINYDYIDKLHSSFQNKMVIFYENSPNVKEISGVSEAFRKLKKQKIKIAIDTGFDRKIADVILKRIGWEANGLIDLSVTSDEVENGRPHPDMVFKAMLLLGIKDSKQVVKVGDTPSDLNEGHSAGCGLNIAVLSGATKQEDLEKHPHTHIIKSVKYLPELLESLAS